MGAFCAESAPDLFAPCAARVHVLLQLLGENQQECPQWLCSMAMYGGSGGGGSRRPRGGGRGNRNNFGARDFRKDGSGGESYHCFPLALCQMLCIVFVYLDGGNLGLCQASLSM